MVQLNLLPAIKLEYIKAAKLKRLVIVGSGIASIVTAVMVILLAAFTFGVRGTHLSNLNDDIDSATQSLESTVDIDKILTIQNQLASLPVLHDTKPNAPKIFDYFAQLTPAEIALNELDFDFTELKASVKGEAPTLKDVNIFIDTLKFSNAVIQPEDTSLLSENEVNGEELLPSEEQEEIILPEPEIVRAFSQVILTSFSFEEGVVIFEIDFIYEPRLFDNTLDVSLNVPNKLTTRSETEKPLFQESKVKNGGQQ